MDFRSLLIFALAFIVTVKVAEGATANACYGTDPTCDFYSIQCASTEVIRLNNLYAGYKNSSIYPTCASADFHCQSSLTCCRYTGASGDFLEFFNLENIYNTYRNCSGRQSCTEIHAPWQLMQTVVSTFSTFSSYVQVEYDCQDATDIIPLCGGPTGTVTRDQSYAEIMFDGSIEKYELTKASKECLCTVTNLGKQQNVVFTTIDVRLESYYRQENQTSAECSSAFLRSDVIAAQCVVSDQHHKNNFHRSNRQMTLVMPTGTTSDISLTNIHENGLYDSPAMVWLSLRAAPDNGVRVTCKEVVSAEPTTTTTSTSTTTTSTTTTTTSTTPMPTTTTTTTTHKPTTTTPKPTTTTPKPTTTTPKPTTTTPKPTTTITTPKPTTSTPKPTTTTIKPTTTTPKPTTTTSKPTTTITTPKPTTTTPKPTTSTPKPTTTTTTIKPTSKSMAVTTITTSTSKPTTSSTSKTTALPTTLKPPVTWRTTAKPPDTTLQPRDTTTNKEGVVPNTGDGENDRQQRIAVYLAICIPIIVCIFIITVLLLWIYWKRTSRRKDKFRFMKGTPRSEVYHTLSNPKILDDFIQQHVGIEPSTPREKPLISSFVSVPEPQKRPRSILSNGSTYRHQQQPPPEPYVIPVSVRKSEPLYSTPIKQPTQNVVHVRLSRDNDYDKTPVIITDTLEPEVKPVKDEDERDEPSQRKSTFRKTPDDGDGSIVIHVDNLSLPPLSARSTNAATSSLNTSSTRSEFGSTQGDLTPERRNSEPALITTDSIVDRRSASAYVLPGTSPDDSTVLFVK